MTTAHGVNWTGDPILWSRNRWFVGVPGDWRLPRVVFGRRYMPTRDNTELLYGRVVGPYRTRKDALEHIALG